MAALLCSSNLTVAQVLEQTPREVAAVFLARKTACVGCYLVGFCTLEDVAGIYRIPLDEFFGELERAANLNNPAFKGVQNEKQP